MFSIGVGIVYLLLFCNFLTCLSFGTSQYFYDKFAVFYADDGYENTVAFPLFKNRERSHFQHEMLDLFGLRTVPKPRRSIADETVPAYMLELYKSSIHEQAEDIDESDIGRVNPIFRRYEASMQHVEHLSESKIFDSSAADIIMSFVNQGHRESAQAAQDTEHFDHFFFDIDDVKNEDTLIGAEFRLFRNGSGPLPQFNGVLQINLMMVNTELNSDEHLTPIASTVLAQGSPSKWLLFNVTRALLQWNSDPSSNLGLLVEVVDETGGRYCPKDYGFNTGFMVGYLKAGTKPTPSSSLNARKKRSVEDEMTQREDYFGNPYKGWNIRKLARRSCQRRTLYVSFRDLGWQEWIIAPDGYAAYYCLGECSFPLNAHMNATNHAIVQTLVHLMDPHRAPKPCCAPTHLDSISVLYFDDYSNVVLKKYKNMVVRSCGCH